MAHVLSSLELVTQRKPGQWSKTYLAVPEYHVILTARLNGLPTINDMVAEISVDTEVGTLADVLPDMTLYVGTSAGAFDLGMCRIRKTPITGTFYISETSDIVWQDDAFLTVVDDYSLWQKSLRIAGSTPYMDCDVAYSDQHANFDPVPVMGTHRVAKLTGSSVSIRLGAAADNPAWVIGSTILSRSWSVTGGAATLDNAGAINPIATFTAPGTYLVYCLFTAANGKTFTGVRYVIIWDDTHRLIEHFNLSNGRGNLASGGWSFEVSLFADTSTLRKRSLVILCTEDYAENQPVTLPGQIEGAENILCVGWIADINNERTREFGEISFTVQSAEYWLKQIRDYPSGLKLKTGTAAAWTDMPALTVDRALWHFLHWRSTSTRVMDVQLTGNTRLASKFNIARANLWERLVQVTTPVIFAAPHVDNFGRLIVDIEPQMVPEAERTFPTVMTILDADIEGGISWVRRDVTPISMLFLSGICVDTTGGAASYFSMSPGHSYGHHGEEESQDNYLVESQENSNALCGLYYGWKNNLLDNLELSFVHSMRVLGMSPRQYFYYELDAANDPRGIGFSGNLIAREVSFSQSTETGFIAFSALMEPESFTGPAIKGDVPTMEKVDFSKPGKDNYTPIIPALPIIVLPPTVENANHPKSVILYSDNFGVMYTTTFDTDSPIWYFMNNGLTSLQRVEINNLVVTPNGTLYLLTQLSIVFIADGLGGTWRQLFSNWDYPYQPAIIAGLGVNPLKNDEIAIFGGQNFAWPNWGHCYLSIGNSSGMGGLTEQLNVFTHPYYACVLFSNNGWSIFYSGIGGIMGIFPSLALARCNASGVTQSVTGMSDFGQSPNYGVSVGTSNKIFFWNGIDGYFDVVDVAFVPNLGIDPGERQSISVSPTGNFGMGVNGITPMRTSDGGATWGTAAGVIPVGSSVWENCSDDFRWIFGGGTVIRLTMDWGATYINKMGSLPQVAPLINIIGIRFIE